MKITVEFDSEDEFEAFKTSGKKTRGGRGKNAGNEDESTDNSAPANTAPVTGPASTSSAPAPLQPPADAGPMGGAAFPGASGFPAGPAPTATPSGPSPEVAALVARIIPRVDAALASGQPVEAVTNWFRSQCGPEAANATLDQIKQVFLAKLTVAQLDSIAKLVNA